jgi:hypothetical protein
MAMIMAVIMHALVSGLARLALAQFTPPAHCVLPRSYCVLLTLGYNQLMSATWLARIALIAALVFSQTLYAGHAFMHDNGSLADCQACVQASAGLAGVPGSETGPVSVARSSVTAADSIAAAVSSTFPHSQPSRAPPSHLL